MKKLELKHLAPYLPHRLKMKYCLENGSVWELDIENFNAITDFDKPILRPLSDFGDSDRLREVHEFIGLGNWCENYNDYFKAWFDDLANIDNLILKCPYEVFQFFLANHYDVLGLREKDLCIYYNEL